MNKYFSTLTLLFLGWPLQFVTADDWLCKTDSTQRYGQTIIACGVGEGNTEAIARQQALDSAQKEFHSICDESDDCRNRSSTLTPLRNTCDELKENHTKCYRALRYEIGDKNRNTDVKFDKGNASTEIILSTESKSTLTNESSNFQKRIHLFPDKYFYQIQRIATSSQSTPEKMKQVRAAVCDKSQPRFSINYEIKFIPPITRGMLKDEAIKFRKNLLNSFRNYIQREWLFETGGSFYIGGYYGVGEKEQHDFLHDLYTPYAEDISLLISTFTMKLPITEVKPLLDLKDRTEGLAEDETAIQYFGYDPSDNEWSSRKALDNRDVIWKYAFQSATKITEHSQPDSSINFSIKTNLNLFCRFGIAGTDLISDE